MSADRPQIYDIRQKPHDEVLPAANHVGRRREAVVVF